MGYQKPKANHPWKTGVMIGSVPDHITERKIKPIKIFISEIASSWDNIEVYTYCYGREGKFYLTELPQTKQAAWLAGLIKRSYEAVQE